MSTRDYIFTQDWFSQHIPVLSEHLGHLRDTPCKILEIGSYEGRSSVWFLENLLTHPDARIVCIDPCTGSVEHSEAEKKNILIHFTHNMYRYFPTKVIHYRVESHEALKYHTVCNDKFDMIYVDGNHCAANVLEDAVLSFRMLRMGGVMVFDDLGWTMLTDDKKYSPAVGIQAFMHAYGHCFVILHQGYQLIVKKICDI